MKITLHIHTQYFICQICLKTFLPLTRHSHSISASPWSNHPSIIKTFYSCQPVGSIKTIFLFRTSRWKFLLKIFNTILQHLRNVRLKLERYRAQLDQFHYRARVIARWPDFTGNHFYRRIQDARWMAIPCRMSAEWARYGVARYYRARRATIKRITRHRTRFELRHSRDYSQLPTEPISGYMLRESLLLFHSPNAKLLEVELHTLMLFSLVWHRILMYVYV